MLKRKYAKLCIVLFVVGLALLFLCTVFASFGAVYGAVALGLSLAFIIAAAVIEFVFMRCPSCGLTRYPMLWWFKNDTFYCYRCGKPFIFDKLR